MMQQMISVLYIYHSIRLDNKGRFDYLANGLMQKPLDRNVEMEELKPQLKKALGHLFIQDEYKFKNLYELWKKVDPTFFEIIKETKEDIKKRASKE